MTDYDVDEDLLTTCKRYNLRVWVVDLEDRVKFLEAIVKPSLLNGYVTISGKQTIEGLKLYSIPPEIHGSSDLTNLLAVPSIGDVKQILKSSALYLKSVLAPGETQTMRVGTDANASATFKIDGVNTIIDAPLRFAQRPYYNDEETGPPRYIPLNDEVLRLNYTDQQVINENSNIFVKTPSYYLKKAIFCNDSKDVDTLVIDKDDGIVFNEDLQHSALLTHDSSGISLVDENRNLGTNVKLSIDSSDDDPEDLKFTIKYKVGNVDITRVLDSFNGESCYVYKNVEQTITGLTKFDIVPKIKVGNAYSDILSSSTGVTKIGNQSVSGIITFENVPQTLSSDVSDTSYYNVATIKDVDTKIARVSTPPDFRGLINRALNWITPAAGALAGVYLLKIGGQWVYNAFMNKNEKVCTIGSVPYYENGDKGGVYAAVKINDPVESPSGYHYQTEYGYPSRVSYEAGFGASRFIGFKHQIDSDVSGEPDVLKTTLQYSLDAERMGVCSKGEPHEYAMMHHMLNRKENMSVLSLDGRFTHAQMYPEFATSDGEPVYSYVIQPSRPLRPDETFWDYLRTVVSGGKSLLTRLGIVAGAAAGATLIAGLPAGIIAAVLVGAAINNDEARCLIMQTACSYSSWVRDVIAYEYHDWYVIHRIYDFSYIRPNAGRTTDGYFSEVVHSTKRTDIIDKTFTDSDPSSSIYVGYHRGSVWVDEVGDYAREFKGYAQSIANAGIRVAAWVPIFELTKQYAIRRMAINQQNNQVDANYWRYLDSKKAVSSYSGGLFECMALTDLEHGELMKSNDERGRNRWTRRPDPAAWEVVVGRYRGVYASLILHKDKVDYANTEVLGDGLIGNDFHYFFATPDYQLPYTSLGTFNKSFYKDGKYQGNFTLADGVVIFTWSRDKTECIPKSEAGDYPRKGYGQTILIGNLTNPKLNTFFGFNDGRPESFNSCAGISVYTANFVSENVENYNQLAVAINSHPATINNIINNGELSRLSGNKIVANLEERLKSKNERKFMDKNGGVLFVRLNHLKKLENDNNPVLNFLVGLEAGDEIVLPFHESSDTVKDDPVPPKFSTYYNEYIPADSRVTVFYDSEPESGNLYDEIHQIGYLQMGKNHDLGEMVYCKASKTDEEFYHFKIMKGDIETQKPAFYVFNEDVHKSTLKYGAEFNVPVNMTRPVTIADLRVKTISNIEGLNTTKPLLLDYDDSKYPPDEKYAVQRKQLDKAITDTKTELRHDMDLLHKQPMQFINIGSPGVGTNVQYSPNGDNPVAIGGKTPLDANSIGHYAGTTASGDSSLTLYTMKKGKTPLDFMKVSPNEFIVYTDDGAVYVTSHANKPIEGGGTEISRTTNIIPSADSKDGFLQTTFNKTIKPGLATTAKYVGKFLLNTLIGVVSKRIGIDIPRIPYEHNITIDSVNEDDPTDMWFGWEDQPDGTQKKVYELHGDECRFIVPIMKYVGDVTVDGTIKADGFDSERALIKAANFESYINDSGRERNSIDMGIEYLRVREKHMVSYRLNCAGTGITGGAPHNLKLMNIYEEDYEDHNNKASELVWIDHNGRAWELAGNNMKSSISDGYSNTELTNTTVTEVGNITKSTFNINHFPLLTDISKTTNLILECKTEHKEAGVDIYSSSLKWVGVNGRVKTLVKDSGLEYTDHIYDFPHKEDALKAAKPFDYKLARNYTYNEETKKLRIVDSIYLQYNDSTEILLKEWVFKEIQY